jgi:hypothetical protein
MSGLERGGDRRPRPRSTQPRSREAFAERRMPALPPRCREAGQWGNPRRHCSPVQPPARHYDRAAATGGLVQDSPPQRATISGSFQIDSMRDAEDLKTPTRGRRETGFLR